LCVYDFACLEKSNLGALRDSSCALHFSAHRPT
jgi:hypothetical protein